MSPGRINLSKLLDQRWERNAQHDIVLQVHEIPYRPEYLTHFTREGKPPEAVEWQDKDIVDPSAADDAEWPSGELQPDAVMPEELRSHCWALDERVCQRYGFSFVQVQRVELPALDLMSGDVLMMRVFVRIPAGADSDVV